jgi:hypothetical protein
MSRVLLPWMAQGRIRISMGRIVPVTINQAVHVHLGSNDSQREQVWGEGQNGFIN